MLSSYYSKELINKGFMKNHQATYCERRAAVWIHDLWFVVFETNPRQHSDFVVENTELWDLDRSFQDILFAGFTNCHPAAASELDKGKKSVKLCRNSIQEYVHKPQTAKNVARVFVCRRLRFVERRGFGWR